MMRTWVRSGIGVRTALDPPRDGPHHENGPVRASGDRGRPADDPRPPPRARLGAGPGRRAGRDAQHHPADPGGRLGGPPRAGPSRPVYPARWGLPPLGRHGQGRPRLGSPRPATGLGPDDPPEDLARARGRPLRDVPLARGRRRRSSPARRGRIWGRQQPGRDQALSLPWLAQPPDRRPRGAAPQRRGRAAAARASPHGRLPGVRPVGPLPRLGQRRHDRPHLGPRQSRQPGHGRDPARAHRRRECAGLYPRRPPAHHGRLRRPGHPLGPRPPRRARPGRTRSVPAPRRPRRRRDHYPDAHDRSPTAAGSSSAARTATSSATTPPTSPA